MKRMTRSRGIFKRQLLILDLVPLPVCFDTTATQDCDTSAESALAAVVPSVFAMGNEHRGHISALPRLASLFSFFRRRLRL
jgi:hypothetical protein